MTVRERAPRALTILVIVFLALQLTVPLLSLAGPRPARLGWQMFSDLAPMPAVWLEDASGTLHPIDLDQLLAYGRPEVRLDGPLVRALCRRPGATAVVISRNDDPRRVPC